MVKAWLWLCGRAGKPEFAAAAAPTSASPIPEKSKLCLYASGSLIFAYTGHPCTVAALKLSAMVFVRPGELRTAHLPARREMMQRWSDYLDKLRVGAHVTPFKTVAS